MLVEVCTNLVHRDVVGLFGYAFGGSNWNDQKKKFRFHKKKESRSLCAYIYNIRWTGTKVGLKRWMRTHRP